MIGDNPLSDIEGGNKAGWTTILVRTGVFKSDAATSRHGNDKKNPATHVVEDFKEAIELIYKLEEL
jgi:ribonucleotide monophosphatase NagD (HAD superfamily)